MDAPSNRVTAKRIAVAEILIVRLQLRGRTACVKSDGADAGQRNDVDSSGVRPSDKVGADFAYLPCFVSHDGSSNECASASLGDWNWPRVILLEGIVGAKLYS